ncbi:TVP38/TMEM64 family protein [Microvirga rosea]|uniref:TVP38/TMEM64 family protein n=1 Tax=Microvirga rosea TaxID=2715425 RepID=UPI001D0A9609|nr:TVP38/TMEM64 family protein [Microvirga rosea]MCB8821676.1 TVP38/TMEM64 family protein [Microvirga rosea]
MAVEEQQQEVKGPGASLWRFLPLGLVLIAAGAFFAFGLHHALSLDSLVRHYDAVRHFVDERRLAAFGVYILAYIGITTLSIPASAFLSTLGGYLFGWAFGGIIAAVSATVGATNIFLIARTSLGEVLRRWAGARIQALAKGFNRNAFSYVLFLRILPVMPFWVTNLAAAVFGVRLKTFILATQLGMLPTAFAFAVAGSGLDHVIDQENEILQQCLATGRGDCRVSLSLQDLLTAELMIALGVLSILALFPILFRWWRSRTVKERA